MPKPSPLKQMILENIGTKPEGGKSVSYSQFSQWRECPHRWSLTYKQGIRPFSSSVATVFGTAIHATTQEWLRLLHDVSIKASEELNLEEYLFEQMSIAYKKEIEANGGQHFITRQDLEEHYHDGVKILNYLRTKRAKLFGSRDWELTAIELPLYVPIMDGYNVLFNGYIDLLFYNRKTGDIWMPDIKTSTKGWSDWQKKDDKKLDQVRLYKHYLAKYYQLDVDKISGEYFILKRKVWEDAEFTIPRHTLFIPAQGTAKVKQAVLGLETFVKECFNPDGTYIEKKHKKIPSAKSCKFCPYANTNYCNMVAD